MYKYKYVKHSGEGFMSITFEGACEVIDDYAKVG